MEGPKFASQHYAKKEKGDWAGEYSIHSFQVEDRVNFQKPSQVWGIRKIRIQELIPTVSSCEPVKMFTI